MFLLEAFKRIFLYSDNHSVISKHCTCLLYTSDAADE